MLGVKGLQEQETNFFLLFYILADPTLPAPARGSEFVKVFVSLGPVFGLCTVGLSISTGNFL